MRRREFIKSAALAAMAAGVQLPKLYGQNQESPDPGARRVMVAFMCHLDIGFTNTQANVMSEYFGQYYPRAIAVASKLRERGSRDLYRWTTSAWLLYEYLEQAGSADRKQIEAAIERGDLVWHAMPFNWQTEALDRSMAQGCMGFSTVLDRRFGKKTIGGKMSDVPGHSRGLVPVLAESGVRLLDIGVNSASTPPDVPDAFVWKAPDGSSAAILYHRHSYGGLIRVPGSDLVVDMEVRNDNSGPHSEREIDDIYSTLRQRFPNAKIEASSISEIAAAVELLTPHLPVVTQEIGDTWIYGLPSDPLKLARYREAARLRLEWVKSGRISEGSRNDLQLLRRLALAAEHTWGTDTKRYIDHEHYPPAQLAKYLNQPGYQIMERSWREKRDDIDAGIANLPEPLRSEAVHRLGQLRATPPDTTGMSPWRAHEPVHTRHFDFSLDPANGSIRSLVEKRTGRSWASAANPLALFSYQTLTQADYDAFLKSYIVKKTVWAPQDFGKPNISQFPAQSRSWVPAPRQIWIAKDEQGHRVVAELSMQDATTERAGLVAWPQKMYLELHFPDAEPVVDMTFYSFGKIANRMPEAMWLTFRPQNSGDAKWILDKLGQEVSANDVVQGGGRRMHAVTRKIVCQHEDRRLEITTLDAPVVAMGTKSPLNYSPQLPDMRNGIHFCLFNNAWGTNYPQWAGGDWMYRFRLSV